MNIIIIGATKGIGKELAQILAPVAGNRILVTGRNETVLKNLGNTYSNLRWLKLDMSDSLASSSALAEFARNLFPSVDILVNMAGMLVNRPFMDFNEPEARKIMDVNFFTPSAMIRALSPFMSEGSHIINISSMGGFQGSAKFAGLSYYSASKAAIACLSECLALELSDRRISVNCLALGAVQTEMFSEAFPGYSAPVSATDMALFIADFALTGHKYFNGRIVPVALSNP
jgi:NAD(P)-dependent dehydrogenase (short-subunit alcohol dehydrogenase family)